MALGMAVRALMKGFPSRRKVILMRYGENHRVRSVASGLKKKRYKLQKAHVVFG